MELFSDTFIWVCIGILFFLAYIGIVAPILPDMPFVLAGVALYHFFIDDQEFGVWSWVLLVLLTLILMAIEYFAGGIAASKYGGSRWAFSAALLGAIVFTVIPIFGPLGIIIGPLVTVLIVELLQKKPFKTAGKIALTTLIGFLGGLVVKFLVVSGIIIWFLIAVWN